MGVASWFLQNAQVRRVADENRNVHDLLASHDRFRGVLVMTLAVLSLSAWALYDVLRLGQVQLIVALAAFIGSGVFIGSSVPFWNRFLAYALGKYNKSE